MLGTNKFAEFDFKFEQEGDEIVLTVPYPPSNNLNARFGKFGHYKAPIVNDYKEALKYHFSNKIPLLDEPLSVNVEVYQDRPKDYEKRIRKFGNLWYTKLRMLDCDNYTKIPFDALNNCLWDDDKYICELSIKKMLPDNFGKRMVIKIRKIS